MKKLVSVILLVLCAAVSTAQTAVTLSGGDGSFFINTTEYPVNTVALNFNDDSTYLGIIVLPNTSKVTLRPISYYKRVGGVSFADADAIIAFADSFMFSSGGGGSGTVTTLSSGNLSPLFTSSVATATTTPAISYSLSNAAAYTVLTNSTNATAAPSYQKVVPLALYSTSGTPDATTFYRGDGTWQVPAGGGADSTTFATQYQVDTAKTNLRAGLLLHAQVPVSSAEILSLFTSPKQLLPAPGAGKLIRVTHITIKVNFVSAAYTTSVTMNIYYSGITPTLYPNISGPLAATADGIYIPERSGTNAGTFTACGGENAALMLSSGGGLDPTGGGGNFIFYIDYEILTL